MGKSDSIRKPHNVSVLLYHFVCPARYRKVIFHKEVDETLKEIFMEISRRYPIHFLEIGTDNNHVHFLVQSMPTYSATKIITVVKSITVREIFRIHPYVRKQLWRGEFWSDGYFVNTVSKYGDEDTISQYVKEQGLEAEYKVLHKAKRLSLF